MIHEILTDTGEQMEGVLDIVKEDLGTIKTGRARPSLVEQVEVEAYDTKMPLMELATISAPDPHILHIQAWDESIIENITRGISQSDLNLNPVVDGTLVRIKIPPLTEERRQEFIKLMNQKLESGRVLLRQVRQDAKKSIENMEGKPGVSEDDIHRMLTELEELTEKYMGKLEEIGQVKEREIMTG